MLHQRRAKAARPQFVKGFSDLRGRNCERFVRAIQLSVVLEAVDAKFEASAVQTVSHSTVDYILSLGDEIERGAEPILLCKFHQPWDALEALLPFHIMCQDKSKLFTVGPARPACGNSGGGLVNRPHSSIGFPSALSAPSAKRYAQAPRKNRLKEVIDVCQHLNACLVTSLNLVRIRNAPVSSAGKCRACSLACGMPRAYSRVSALRGRAYCQIVCRPMSLAICWRLRYLMVAQSSTCGMPFRYPVMKPQNNEVD